MIRPSRSSRTLLALGLGSMLAFAQAHAAPAKPAPAKPAAAAAKPGTAAAAPAAPQQPGSPVAPQIVLQNGIAIPLSAVVLKGDNYEFTAEVGKFGVGATIPVTSVDHVFGDKPPGINQAIALLLTGKPTEARKLLEPILAEHKDSAKLPGNFWLEAAHAAVVANAVEGAAPQCNALGKQIAAASPGAAANPFAGLCTALLMHNTVKLADREAALKAQTTDAQPAEVCAYASFFLAGLLQSEKLNDEALEAYLAVPCLFPSGGMVINGVAQFKAAEFLTAEGRRVEAVGLVQSAMRYTKDTVARDLANKLYESIK